MTAAVALDAYGDPAVIDCSQHCELRAEWLLDGGIRTAYLCAPQDEQQRLRSLFVTLIASVLSEVYERATRTGRFRKVLSEVYERATRTGRFRKVGHARTVSATRPGPSPPNQTKCPHAPFSCHTLAPPPSDP